MLRSEIRSEIFYLPVPSRHGKERQKERRKRLFPESLSSTTSTRNASPCVRDTSMPAVIPGSVMKESGRLINQVFPNDGF